jgi:hypothetical protein
MGAISEPSGELILTKIRESLQRAELECARLRVRNTRLTGSSILSGGLATAVGALAVSFGPVLGHGPGGWKITCAVATIFTACATICSGLNQHLAIPDHLAKATACAGRLRALELEISVFGRNPSDVAKEYEELVAAYEEFMF